MPANDKPRYIKGIPPASEKFGRIPPSPPEPVIKPDSGRIPPAPPEPKPDPPKKK